MTILPAADLTLKKLGLGVRVNREGFGVGDRSRADRRKKLTISWDNSILPSYCHIVHRKHAANCVTPIYSVY